MDINKGVGGNDGNTALENLKKLTEKLPAAYELNNIFTLSINSRVAAEEWKPTAEDAIEPANKFQKQFHSNPMQAALILGHAEGITATLRDDFATPYVKSSVSTPVLKYAETLSRAIIETDTAMKAVLAEFPADVRKDFDARRSEAAKSTHDKICFHTHENEERWRNTPSFSRQIGKAFIEDMRRALSGETLDKQR